MKGRIKEDDSSVPMKDGPFAYGSSFKKGGEQPRFFRTPRDGGTEEIIFDGDRRGRRKAIFPDRRRRPFGRSPPPALGLRRQGLGILHAARSRACDRRRPRRSNSGYRRLRRVERLERRVFLYPRRSEPPAVKNILPRARLGRLQGPAGLRRKRSRLLHECRRLAHEPVGHSSRSTITKPRNSGCCARTTRKASRSWSRPGKTGLQYDLEEGGEIFFILTNADGAKDFKIMTAPVVRSRRAPTGANWFRMSPAG